MRRALLAALLLVASPAFAQAPNGWQEMANGWGEIQTPTFSYATATPPASATLGCVGVFLGSPLTLQCDAGIGYDAATDTLTSGVFRMTTTDTGAATAALVMNPVDSTVAHIGVWMGNTTCAGVKDPTMFWGYNYTPQKAGHQRLYWALEGNYNDVPNSHVWSETYLERQDSTGNSYRPFGIGCYDGHCEGALNLDVFNLGNRLGTGGVGQIANAGAAPYFLLNPTSTITALGNNRSFLEQASAFYPGNYLGILGMDSSDRVMLGDHWAVRGVVIKSAVVAGSKPTALTDGAATPFATFPIADWMTYGGKVTYAVIAIKGTAKQRLDGEIRFSVTREDATYTAVAGTTAEAASQVLAAADGTLTGGVTVACTAGICTLSANFDTSQSSPTSFTFNGRIDSPDEGLLVTWIP